MFGKLFQVCGVAFAYLVFSAAAVGNETISLWVHNLQAAELTASLCRQFTQKSGIAVDVRVVDGSLYKPELIRSVSEERAPDVALLPADFLAMDRELHFSELPAASLNKDLVKLARQTGLYEGKMLGAPIYWGNHLLLYYNRDLVARPAASFEELERQSAAFKAKGVTPLGLNFGEMYSFIPFLSGFGGWPLDEKGLPALNSPAMVQALDFYFGLVSKGLMLKDCSDDCGHTRFSEGRSAYFLGGDWMYHRLEKQLGARFGVAALPSIGGRPAVPMFSSYVLAFPDDSLSGPKRDSLLKFAAFLQTPAAQARWANEAKLFPVSDKAFRAFVARAPKNSRVSLTQLQHSRIMPNHRNMAFAWEGMAKGFSSMESGRSNAQQAAALMQKTTENAIKRAKD